MLWNGDYLSCSTYPVDQQDDSCDFFFDWLTQDIGKNRNDAVSDQQTNKQTTLNVSQLVLKLTHSLWVNLTHFESTSLTLSQPHSLWVTQTPSVTVSQPKLQFQITIVSQPDLKTSHEQDRQASEYYWFIS